MNLSGEFPIDAWAANQSHARSEDASDGQEPAEDCCSQDTEAAAQAAIEARQTTARTPREDPNTDRGVRGDLLLTSRYL
jgi:hypothetical protein